jgi:hypothetical protein
MTQHAADRKEVYLGDGLYARFDGYMVILRAPRLGGEHWIGLEPPVYAALLEFVASLKRSEESAP